jgi:penicillin-binding protein 2
MAKAKDDIYDRIKGVYKNLVRINTMGWVVSVCMFLLIARSFYLQIIKGGDYKKMADENCITLSKLPAARGYIYDRNYVPLVINKPADTAVIIPYYFAQNGDRAKSIERLALILGMEVSDIEDKISAQGGDREYMLMPVTIKRNISEKEMSQIKEEKLVISGIDTMQEPIRYYPNKNVASHVLGYVGEITEEQLKWDRYRDKKKMGDVIGQTGIENNYDETLRGDDGAKYILTDAHGRQLGVKKTVQPVQGSNLVLTIDYRLQRFAENLLDSKHYNGVIIAEDPRTGEILCMASKPDYNLNYFSGSINSNEWKSLIRNKANPLTNRAVQGLYSPGSIFKVAVGTGALNEGVVKTSDSFLCEGIYWIKTWPYKCWKRAGHGFIDFYHGVAESCDIYFYKVGLKMKVELLYKYGVMFGLGEKTGIDIPGEKAGLVPSREWKMRVDRSPWFPGNTVMMAIGQGYITATPLQIMNIMAAMANSGYVMTPHIMKVVTNDSRRILSSYEPKKLFELSARPEVIDIMKSALRMVVSRGTGSRSRVEGMQVSGKTSTVQNVHGENHAMFAGYAPSNNPEIVVYVLVEFGGGGGEAAAPLAGQVFDYYFNTLKGK